MCPQCLRSTASWHYFFVKLDEWIIFFISYHQGTAITLLLIGLLLYGVFQVGAMGKIRMEDPRESGSEFYNLVSFVALNLY